MHWITIDFSSGVIIEYHNRGLSLERQWFSTASEVLRTQSKLPSMIIAIIALLWRLPLYSPLVIIGVKELYSKTLIDDNSVNYPSTLLLIRHNNTFTVAPRGANVVNLEDHFDELRRQEDLLLLAVEGLDHVLHLHVCAMKK